MNRATAGGAGSSGLLKAHRSGLLTTVALAAVLAASPPVRADGPQSGDLAAAMNSWWPWVEFGGQFRSDRANGGGATLWAPVISGPTWLWFTQLTGNLREEDIREGNLALGYRRMLEGGWTVGGWTSLDVVRSPYDNTFTQWSGGLEALSPNWEFRLNGFLPMDRSKTIGQTRTRIDPMEPEVVLTSDHISLLWQALETFHSRSELALGGAEAEAGFRVWGSDGGGLLGPQRLKLYVGGFWYGHQDFAPTMAGPMVRAEWTVDDPFGPSGSRLAVEAGLSYDQVRRERWHVGARLKIPLGATARRGQAQPLFAQQQRMMERVQRQNNIETRIVTKRTRRIVEIGEESVADQLTGVPLLNVARVQDGGSITQASAAAGDNSLIILDGTATGPQSVQGRQTLQGAGSTIQVVGIETGTVAALALPGHSTIENTSDAPALSLNGSNIHVAEIDVHGAAAGNPQNVGIYVAPDAQNVVIESTAISDTGGDGIIIGEGSGIGHVSIVNSRISRTGGDGINGSGIGQLNVLGTDIWDVSRAGISVSDPISPGAGNAGGLPAAKINVLGSTIWKAQGDGIVVGSNNELSVTGTTISDVGGDGIWVDRNNAIEVFDSIIDRVGGNGVTLGHDSSIYVVGSTIRASKGQAIARLDVPVAVAAGPAAATHMLDSDLSGSAGKQGLAAPDVPSALRAADAPQKPAPAGDAEQDPPANTAQRQQPPAEKRQQPQSPSAPGLPQNLPAPLALPDPIAFPEQFSAFLGNVTTVDQAKQRGAIFQKYEDDFAAYSEKRWQEDGASWEASNYYDRASIYYAWYARTGDSKYLARADAIAESYLKDYVEANNYGVASWWSMPKGIAAHYFVHGDEASLTAIGKMADEVLAPYNTENNWANLFDPHQTEGREQARALETLTLAAMLKAPSVGVPDIQPNGEDWGVTGGNDFRARAKSLVNKMLTSGFQRPDGSRPHFIDGAAADGQPIDKPFMNGLVNEALILYFEKVDPDPRIPNFIKENLDYMWSNEWDPQTKSFRYIEKPSVTGVEATPAPDLNMLIVNGFGFIYKETGDTTYLERGDMVFSGGVEGSWLDGSKQFNQGYATSYKYFSYTAPTLP